jgi:antitoxin component YwqK of YwqJK toxin-antitoxin module
LSLEFLFKNGHLISLKEYHKNGNIVFEVDYNRKYQNYFLSYYFKMYNENGGIMLDGYHVLMDGELKYIDRKKHTD